MFIIKGFLKSSSLNKTTIYIIIKVSIKETSKNRLLKSLKSEILNKTSRMDKTSELSIIKD